MHADIQRFLLILALEQALQPSQLLLQLLTDFVYMTLSLPS